MTGPRIRRNASGAPTNDSGTFELTPAIFRAPTPAPASDPGPLGRYTDKDLQRATNLALESFVKGQEHSQLQASTVSRDRSFKARNPDLYYKSLHIKCYYFCRQYENHFDTAGATSHKHVPFAASFLRDWINFRWQQHKTQVESDNAISTTWDKFKAFLWQTLRESTSFVTSIWTKIKQDSQYQQEEVQDWASHLQYLKSILVEFDPQCASTEDLLCRYFYKELRPFIRL